MTSQNPIQLNFAQIKNKVYQGFFKQKEELHKSSSFWLKTSCKKNVPQQCSIQRELHFTSHLRF